MQRTGRNCVLARAGTRLLAWATANMLAVAGVLAAEAPAAAPHIFAAPQAAAAPAAPGVGGLGQVTLALLLVLAAVFAVAWVVKRMRGFGNRLGTAIDVIADIPLGQKERAVLLKVGSAQILVGVAPGQVSTLYVLAEPIEIAKPGALITDPRPNFKSILLRSLGK
jgi:flagellar protein FliO/FliZ